MEFIVIMIVNVIVVSVWGARKERLGICDNIFVWETFYAINSRS